MGECLICRRGGERYKLPILNASYPQDVTKTVIKGNTTSAAFNAVISEAGNPAEYTYQWYVNGVAVSGATGSSYTKSDLSTTATYTVYCEVTNKVGTVTTRVATLKVTQYYTPVLNTSYPADVSSVVVGDSATFKVTIATEGVPASYTYQWYVNGSAVSGATSSSYTKSSLALGTYTVYCKVTNSAGTVQSRTATLTVGPVPLVLIPNSTRYPASAWTKTGSGTSITVTSAQAKASYSDYNNNDANTVVIGIDVTNFTKMELIGTCAVTDGSSSTVYLKTGLFTTSSLITGYSTGLKNGGSATINNTYDISNVSGTVYFGFYFQVSSNSSYDAYFTMTSVKFT